MNQLRSCAGVLAALLLTGCDAGQQTTQGHVTGRPGHVTGRPGHVTGRLLMEGGPPGPGGRHPGQRPMRGTVTLTATAKGHPRVTVQVGPSGAFSVPLPPGRYQVSGRSPDIIQVDGGRKQEPPCSQPLSATVTAGHTVTVSVICVVR
jgi:hypothetical protein